MDKNDLIKDLETVSPLHHEETLAKERWLRKWFVVEAWEEPVTRALVEAKSAEEALAIAARHGIVSEDGLLAFPAMRDCDAPVHCRLCPEPLPPGNGTSLCGSCLASVVYWLAYATLIPREQSDDGERPRC